MKRVLKLTVFLIMLILTFSLVSFAADEAVTGTAGENITWTIDAKGVLTLSGTGDMPNYNWYEKKAPWYSQRLNVKKVVVNEGITSIGACAFKDAVNITAITIPVGVKSIGKEAFYGCTALASIECPEGLDTIGTGAFRNCTKLKTITLSSTLSSLGDSAFYGCEALSKITLPETLTVIKEYTFYGCKTLPTIVVPKSVKTIEAYAFANCTALNYLGMVSGLMYINEGAFSNCAKLTRVNFPDSLENIGKNAFYNCIKLTTLTFPESLITIGSGAFSACNAINRITYSGTTEQWSDVKKGINNTPLTKVSITYKGDSIPKVLGYGECGENLKWEFNDRYTLVITGTGDMDNYKLNGPNAPWYAVRPYIRKVQISDGITSIGDFAFRDCAEIKTLVIPDSVTRIGDYAFSNCRIMETITMPKELLTIGKNAFRDCAALTAIELPEKLTSIGENAFFKCRTIKEIVLPNSLTSLGQDAFIYCSNLEKVTLSKSMETVRTGTFKATVLKELRVPSNIRTFSEGAFADCTAELTVYTLCSEDEWKTLRVGANNDALTNAKVSYKKAAEDITVTLDGAVVDCEKYGQKACIVEGRTLVPLRAIFEALTATVEWNAETYTVTSTLGETNIKLTIGEKTLYKNETPVELDVPAMLISDRTMVPARAVAEAYGVNVEWDEYTRTVILVNPTTQNKA